MFSEISKVLKHQELVLSKIKQQPPPERMAKIMSATDPYSGPTFRRKPKLVTFTGVDCRDENNTPDKQKPFDAAVIVSKKGLLLSLTRSSQKNPLDEHSFIVHVSPATKAMEDVQFDLANVTIEHSGGEWIKFEISAGTLKRSITLALVSHTSPISKIGDFLAITE